MRWTEKAQERPPRHRGAPKSSCLGLPYTCWTEPVSTNDTLHWMVVISKKPHPPTIHNQSDMDFGSRVCPTSQPAILLSLSLARWLSSLVAPTNRSVLVDHYTPFNLTLPQSFFYELQDDISLRTPPQHFIIQMECRHSEWPNTSHNKSIGLGAQLSKDKRPRRWGVFFSKNRIYCFLIVSGP